MKLAVALSLLIAVAVGVSQVLLFRRIASFESALDSRSNTESIDRRLDALRRTVSTLSLLSAKSPAPGKTGTGTAAGTGPGTGSATGTEAGTEVVPATAVAVESAEKTSADGEGEEAEEDSALAEISAAGTGEAVKAVGRPEGSPSLEGRRKVLEEIRSQLLHLDRKDQKISLKEFQGDLADFLYFDRDSNGSVTPHEMARVLAVEERAAARVAAGDRDGDGGLSPTEFQGSPRQFRFVDENADGRILPQELVASHRRVNERFSGEDVNHDRKITPAEFSGGSARFEKFDRNKDGALDRSELKDMLERGY